LCTVPDVNAACLDVAEFTAARHPAGIYQGMLDAGVFALPSCVSCARMHYPPRVLCPHCGSEALVWLKSSGRGAVYSTSTLAPRDEPPYAVVLVDLDDGPRMMSNISGMAPDAVRIELRVKVRIVHRGGTAIPVFEPEDAHGF
jgi:uncharacterized OB-fold protein